MYLQLCMAKVMRSCFCGEIRGLGMRLCILLSMSQDNAMHRVTSHALVDLLVGEIPREDPRGIPFMTGGGEKPERPL